MSAGLHRLIPVLVAVTTAVAVLPAAAVAAPERGPLVPVTEGSIESGRPTPAAVRPGYVSRGPIGVRNSGRAPVTGLVAEVHLNDDRLRFSRLYDNCWYALEEEPDTAWCEFPDEIVAQSVLQMKGPVFSLAAGTEPGARIANVTFGWASKEWADANGGIEALAAAEAAEGTEAVQGDQGTLALEPGSPRLRQGPNTTTGFLGTTVLPATGTPPDGLPAIPPSDPDTARLAAVQEASDEPSQGPVYDLGPRHTLGGVVGVRNTGDAPVDGLVAELRLSDTDLSFAGQWSNCWFATEDKPGSAWCEFDGALAPGATRKIDGPVAVTGAEGRAEIFKDVRFHWVSKAWAAGHGGIEALARIDATPGTEPVRGTGDTLTLTTAPAGLVGHLRGSTDFVLGLWPPGATEPTPSPTATSSPTPKPTTSTSPAPGNGGDDNGGGTGGEDDGTPGGGGGGGDSLPITGSPVAVTAGVGVALLLAGLLTFFTARRRMRTTV
ncbi:hypothetical protein [Symbioplanes lichenis]|uniref:hypothetical protein n=1 Tax=Symbioplanes lichenis TaxID=1629072 RepID=UPI0027386AF2|nr:hypothetical protein [Actinoplanes lichenis]